jgi:hypothetical protein
MACRSRRCLALTPPVPGSRGRTRPRLQQPPADDGTPPQLHEHAAAVQQAFAALQVDGVCNICTHQQLDAESRR